MTTYIDYTAIVTVLTARWDTSVIALPGFKETENEYKVVFAKNEIQIVMGSSESPPATSGSDPRDTITTGWEMYLVNDSKAKIDKYLDQCRSIFRGYTSIDGFWHVDNWKKEIKSGLHYYKCTCSEVLWDFA